MFAADVARALVGAEHVVRNMEPSMGAEDFSFMLQVQSGAYLRIGQAATAAAAQQPLRLQRRHPAAGLALHAGLIEQSMQLASH